MRLSKIFILYLALLAVSKVSAKHDDDDSRSDGHGSHGGPCDDGSLPLCKNGDKPLFPPQHHHQGPSLNNDDDKGGSNLRSQGDNDEKSKQFEPCKDGSRPLCKDGSKPRPRPQRKGNKRENDKHGDDEENATFLRSEKSGNGEKKKTFEPCDDGSLPLCKNGDKPLFPPQHHHQGPSLNNDDDKGGSNLRSQGDNDEKSKQFELCKDGSLPLCKDGSDPKIPPSSSHHQHKGIPREAFYLGGGALGGSFVTALLFKILSRCKKKQSVANIGSNTNNNAPLLSFTSPTLFCPVNREPVAIKTTEGCAVTKTEGQAAN